MNKISVSIEILGKIYQIKCPEDEVATLKAAAKLLEERMDSVRDGGMISHDKIAVVASLNLAHQILLIEQRSNEYVQTIQQRLQNLQSKVDTALAQNAQMELATAE